MNLRAQDAPHSLSGALAEQFRWYALHHPDATLHCNVYTGITIILHHSGNTKGGCRRLRSNLRKPITLPMPCSAKTDWESSLWIVICVSQLVWVSCGRNLTCHLAVCIGYKYVPVAIFLCNMLIVPKIQLLQLYQHDKSRHVRHAEIFDRWAAGSRGCWRTRCVLLTSCLWFWTADDPVQFGLWDMYFPAGMAPIHYWIRPICVSSIHLFFYFSLSTACFTPVYQM